MFFFLRDPKLSLSNAARMIEEGVDEVEAFCDIFFNGKKMPHWSKNVKYVLITLLIEISQIRMSLKGKIVR